jgi:Tfp pilus assembly protein PilP
MLDYFPKLVRRNVEPNLKSWRDRFKGVGTVKINIIVIITLVIVTRLFFSISFKEKAWAKQVEANGEINLENIDPMKKIRTEEDIKEEKVCAEVVDRKESEIGEKIKIEEKKLDPQDKKIEEILAGYPMAKMTEAISKKDKETAAFLVAIAKKESDWGKHAPSKSGRDCYNYWGYKGGYNPVQGYSCFDSPEQAVEIVGGRIDSLTDKGLNTPERMVVWKCGSSCSWDRPEAVQSWIGAVRIYWRKLMA